MDESSGSDHHSLRRTLAPLQAIPSTQCTQKQGLALSTGHFLKVFTLENDLYTKPETETDIVHVSSCLIFGKLEGKQMCARMRRSRRREEKLIDHCESVSRV